jgi:hypothetical protein
VEEPEEHAEERAGLTSRDLAFIEGGASSPEGIAFADFKTAVGEVR